MRRKSSTTSGPRRAPAAARTRCLLRSSIRTIVVVKDATGTERVVHVSRSTFSAQNLTLSPCLLCLARRALCAQVIDVKVGSARVQAVFALR